VADTRGAAKANLSGLHGNHTQFWYGFLHTNLQPALRRIDALALHVEDGALGVVPGHLNRSCRGASGLASKILNWHEGLLRLIGILGIRLYPASTIMLSEIPCMANRVAIKPANPEAEAAEAAGSGFGTGHGRLATGG
jgi:hypothetical protein